MKGVESKGTAWMVGSTWSERAIEWDAKSETTSSVVKPASVNLAKISSSVSFGSGTRPSGEACWALGRPAKNSSCGAPGHWVRPTAVANWIRSLVMLSATPWSGVACRKVRGRLQYDRLLSWMSFLLLERYCYREYRMYRDRGGGKKTSEESDMTCTACWYLSRRVANCPSRACQIYVTCNTRLGAASLPTPYSVHLAGIIPLETPTRLH